MNKLLEIKDLSKSFGNHKVLDNINTNIYKGDVLCLVGPSGGGKSTFLRTLNMLEIPTSGSIVFEGTDLTDKKTNLDDVRKKIGMVFQHFNLFPHLTILENMTLAPKKVLKISDDEATEMICPIHLVLIEEPEAHLHVQVQQVFIKNAYKILRNNSIYN